MTDFQSIACPANSPWGAIQTRHEIAPGIWSVSTASHGGMYLSDERMTQIPEDLRETPYSPGNWFEEDCDWAIVIVTFPDEFTGNYVELAERTMESVRDYMGAAS